MEKLKNWAITIKQTLKQPSFFMILFFLLSKIFMGIIELPHMTKKSTYIPQLLIELILIIGAIASKFYKHRFLLLRALGTIQKQCFIIWIITLILMIFSWSLADNLQWNLIQKILLILCQFGATFTITLILSPIFINKTQFLGFECILAVQIIFVSLKTVGFIKDHSQSPDKDIVLLNLTTQIALMIVFMDIIQRNYSKLKQKQVDQDMSRLQNQMVFTSRTRKSSLSTPAKQSSNRQALTHA